MCDISPEFGQTPNRFGRDLWDMKPEIYYHLNVEIDKTKPYVFDKSKLRFLIYNKMGNGCERGEVNR